MYVSGRLQHLLPSGQFPPGTSAAGLRTGGQGPAALLCTSRAEEITTVQGERRVQGIIDHSDLLLCVGEAGRSQVQSWTDGCEEKSGFPHKEREKYVQLDKT